jgi:hypothetical protein
VTDKKGLREKIFGTQESCCCGLKIVPKTNVTMNMDEKRDLQE